MLGASQKGVLSFLLVVCLFELRRYTLSNLGNGTSVINYGAWGAEPSAAPFSGYKTTEYEAGTRVPFIFKIPGESTQRSNTPSSNVIKAFAFVQDLTPTILEYAGVQQTGTVYNGHLVHHIMGKSLAGLFNGSVDRVYGENDMLAEEMFNNTAVWMGDWKAIKHEPPVGDGKWQLHNLVDDPTETVNLADMNPYILQKLISAYEKYAQEVGIVIPRGQAFADALASTPPIYQSEVTITQADITPANFTQID